MRLRLALLRGVVAETRAEGEPLHVRRDDEGEALAIGPAVILPLGKRDEVVAVVLRQQRSSQPSLRRPSRSGPAWRFPLRSFSRILPASWRWRRRRSARIPSGFRVPER